ncbi:SLC13 family permease [Planococcus maitriensis]|uniref:SLC13 family permease n=1 Tax=Planococcus maitriensis TaxID=221799 RepID=A0A365KBG5_9BACL|nr:SLC13 family permease [Planococcus maitriensis]RAZ69671.1 SLC13 family permease [Planococcus maitriensis]
MDMVLTFAIVGVTIVLFLVNWLRSDLVALLALLAFVVFGLLEPEEALAGFSNSVVIMIAGLFVIGAGIVRTGLAAMVGNQLLKWSGANETKLFVLILLITGLMGSFMSNTGTVALMLPIVIGVALSLMKSPTQYLIPLSYIGSLSGLMTLIATPANLIVSQVLAEAGYGRLAFFDITPLGVTAIAVGILYFVLFRKWVLPQESRKNQVNEGHKLSPKQLAADYALGGNLHKVMASADSEAVGQVLRDLQIPAHYQLAVLKIERRTKSGFDILPMRFEEMAGPQSEIQAGDKLYVQGSLENAERFANDFGFDFDEAVTEGDALVSRQFGIAEVLLTPHSSFINETLTSLKFREKYNVNALAINRKGDYVVKDMIKEKLRFGDAILVQGRWEDIELLQRATMDVVVVGQPQEHAGTAVASGKAPVAGVILLAMIVLMVLEVFAPVFTVLLAAAAMVLTGSLRNMDDAYSKMNWESIILIAALLPMATALEKSGGMELISSGLVSALGGFGVIGVLAGIYMITMVFGQFISNTATAVLFAPIALQAAVSLDANPVTFLIAIAVSSSMAFATPIASPTNALVMTAGGYKFSDFAKAGIPLQLIMFAVMMVMIPLLFPL